MNEACFGRTILEGKETFVLAGVLVLVVDESTEVELEEEIKDELEVDAIDEEVDA